jgi:hypothetical protein
MTQWSALVAYKCANCSTDSINHQDTDLVDLHLCAKCFYDLPDSLLNRALSSPPQLTAATTTRARPSGAPARDDRREDPSQRESPAGGPERECGTVLSNAATSLDSDE